MRCPYCAEEVKDDALVCKHCQRELFVVKPLLDKVDNLGAQLAALKETLGHEESQPAVQPAYARRAVAHQHGWGLSALECVALTFIVLAALHFCIMVQFNLKLIYFNISSIVVPVIFGLLCRQLESRSLILALIAGLAASVMTIAWELALIASLDKVPFLPQNEYQWHEFERHSASIAFGFLTGVIGRQLLIALYSPHAKPNRAIEWIARFLLEQFGDGKRKFTLKAARSMVNSILGFASAVISIVTGLWEYLLK